jgi:hypothetical protein
VAERKFLFFNATYGHHEEQDTASDTLTLFGLTMGGNIGMATHKITGLGTPTDGTDAATKTYVDDFFSGLVWRNPAAVLYMISDANQMGVDPVGPAVGDCYVVNNWATQTDGNIVEWSGTAWVTIVTQVGSEPPNGTRVVVKSSGAAGSFAGHGTDIATYNATTNVWAFEDAVDGWAVLINGAGSLWDNTAWTYHSTEWVQFSGAGQITAGAGLTKTGNTLDIGKGDGIAIGTDAISLALAVNPGLTLSGTSPDKVLAVLAYAAGGVQVSANGVELKIDDTPDTLDVDGDGVKVVGVPSLFKINDVAVSANVTAVNLGTLTAGGSSNADLLHTHSFPSTDAAQRLEATHVNSEIVATGRVVRWSAVNDQIAVADNDTAPHARAIGIARTGGAASPGTSSVVKGGVCTGCLSGATVGEPYYLGTAGALVPFASVPRPGQVIRLGFAKNATDLDIQPMDYGRRV